MSWKKKFAVPIKYGDLPEIGPFRINEEPESLGEKKYRAKLVTTSEDVYTLTTFENTIGLILKAQGPENWARAYVLNGRIIFATHNTSDP